MREETITRAYLETLSFSDLVRLADEFGVDVPVDLDRRFLIAELLELSEEADVFDEEMVIDSNLNSVPEITLQGNYNETQITGILRNPAWLFVFWNISDSDMSKLKETPGSLLKLRICSYANPKDTTPEEAFEIQASTENQEQYVLIPNGKKFIKTELLLVTPVSGEVLAFSSIISIPQGSELVNKAQFDPDIQFPPVIELSGIRKVLTEQYKYHRHLFS